MVAAVATAAEAVVVMAAAVAATVVIVRTATADMAVVVTAEGECFLSTTAGDTLWRLMLDCLCPCSTCIERFFSLTHPSRNGFSNGGGGGGYGGGGGGFGGGGFGGAGGDRMAALGAGLRQQDWGEFFNVLASLFDGTNKEQTSPRSPSSTSPSTRRSPRSRTVLPPRLTSSAASTR